MSHKHSEKITLMKDIIKRNSSCCVLFNQILSQSMKLMWNDVKWVYSEIQFYIGNFIL